MKRIIGQNSFFKAQEFVIVNDTLMFEKGSMYQRVRVESIFELPNLVKEMENVYVSIEVLGHMNCYMLEVDGSIKLIESFV